ncbi:F83DB protein, partial [Edolisoma coerulescens]|nr:F83DB protein [Edolisoma coerulescens]
MANASQCLEEGSGRWPPPAGPYSEAQRLALEELVAGGPEALRAFLGSASTAKIGTGIDKRSYGTPSKAKWLQKPCRADSVSLRRTSSTIHKERRSVAPRPAALLPWPAQPLYPADPSTRSGRSPVQGSPLMCSARQMRLQKRPTVIALVMDSFTDIEIFSDLQDAYKHRQVPVYILLDQEFVPHFLEMCNNLGVCPEQESMMRVRTLTGSTYYMRSGAKIVGKAKEKFMLIDGIRVATGSYRQVLGFTWSDGKLNSSNLLVLSGQVVEHFDLQFRILYAQSLPISPKRPSSCRNSGMFDHLLTRTESSKEYTVEGNLRAEFARLSSTPKKMLEKPDQTQYTPAGKLCNLGHSCLCEEESFSSQVATVEQKSASTQTGPWEEMAAVTTCNAATQASAATADTGTQASVTARVTGTQTSILLKTAVTQTKEAGTETPLFPRKLSKEEYFLSGKAVSSSSLQSLSSSSSQCSLASSAGSVSSLRSFEYSSSHRAQYFQKLHKERQFHYSTIRSKLSHMVGILSRRGRVPGSYMTQYPGGCSLK